MEITVSGFGGQGVILIGQILGRASAIHAGKFATMTQSFGPEARGSSCSASLIISSDAVMYPYVTKPDLLIAMSQDAFSKHINNVKDGGTVVIEEDLVKFDKLPDHVRVHKIAATRLAEEIGKRVVLNIVMLGFLTAVTKMLDRESVKKALLELVPHGTEEINLKAFEMGYEAGTASKN